MLRGGLPSHAPSLSLKRELMYYWAPHAAPSVIYLYPVGVFLPARMALQSCVERDRKHGRLARQPQERHASLLRCPAAFAVVTGSAGRHHIFPAGCATLGARLNVVDRQLGPTWLGTTVLAC